MHAFTYDRASTMTEALSAAVATDAQVIAGGTELLNWLKEGIVSPRRIVDLNHVADLPATIVVDEAGLHLGARARMSDVAEHPAVRREFPAVAEALLRSASAQLRHMATMGGNLLQRTRCPYFRAETDLPCNKRRPGSGCAAWEGEDRTLAVFGWSPACIATHPSDVAVAFAALDAVVRLHGPGGARTVPLVEFHRLPGDTPERDTQLEPGELIVGIDVPASAVAQRSHYLKLRERASYEFALVSTAVGLDLEDGRIREARIALGGVAHKPWRLRIAEDALRGVAITDEPALRAALSAGFSEARPRRHNGFKIELGARLVLRALQQLGGAA